MSLTAKDVAEITKLLEESEFDELFLEIDGMKLTLRRGDLTTLAAKEPAAGSEAVTEASRPPAPAGSPTASAANDPRQHGVTAPLLGTFYRAPKPGAPPFVDIGTEVEPDTVIGIIEVMKLMNTVRAGVRGRVAQIVARDGVLVEYGETLLLVSRAA